MFTFFDSKTKIIDGRTAGAQLQTGVARRIQTLKSETGKTPGLAVLRLGSDPASEIYVSYKKRACEAVGMRSIEIHLPDTVTQDQALDYIDAFNGDDSLHGVLVQLPVPKQIDPNALIERLDPEKDVDGLHPLNVGLLSRGSSRAIVPCTPKGCLTLIKGVRENLQGLNAVVIGRSNLMGKPMAQLLLKENCTVSIVHSKTSEPELITRFADIIVAAVGVPHLVTPAWVKEGAIVIDVGITRQKTETGSRKLLGDVHFEAVLPKVQAITPVPGGVGPMTVSSLLENTLEVFERTLKV
ncbi:MAG: bifunctional methylenetetrahydrofolate dehydrogenase/methenyltetrahydrofolate cyclohydrolase FolD [bacterium]|nr:bifunctional methylenetetrahydrofolate dehydrogenase/methenyltetrahydrofolate cyclohydrolase FolD [bacterium]